jgi:hypothetical protein
MKNTIILTSVLMLAVGQAVRAQEDTTNNVVTSRTTVITIADDGRLYRAPELSIDGFGSAAFSENTLEHLPHNHFHHNTRLGAGGGINFFFLRMVGIGADAYSEDTRGSFVDSASGNLILRLPILHTGLAPYIFGGGGHRFDPADSNFAQGGGGLEFRFLPNFGIFIDARYVFEHHLENYGLARAGFRIAF